MRRALGLRRGAPLLLKNGSGYSPGVDMPGEAASMAANILGASRAPGMAKACDAGPLLPQVWPMRALTERGSWGTATGDAER